MELRSAVTWKDEVEAALERMWASYAGQQKPRRTPTVSGDSRTHDSPGGYVRCAPGSVAP